MARLLALVNSQTLRILALLAVIIVLMAFFATQIPDYINGRLFNRVASSVAIMALIATGQTLVILTRNIDLSLGSVVGFTAFAAGGVISSHPDLNPLLLVTNMKAGHGGASGRYDYLKEIAFDFAFLLRELGVVRLG